MARFHHTIKNKFIKQVPSLHHEDESYKWWVLANIMIGTFIAVLDATIVNVGLPKIMATFGASVDKIEWILTAYLLIFGIMLPASGWVADHLGYKRTYFASILIFTLGSLLCGLSWNEDVLIASRIIQGFGAGFMMPVGMAIVLREFPYKQRGLALGFWGIAAAASVSFGPLIGGYLIDNFSWNSIFYVNVPIGIFGLFATMIIQREYKTEKVRSFDFVGFLSMTVFLTFLLLALSEGNAAWNTGGWTSGFILTCFSFAIIGLVVFLIVDLSIEHPFVELRVFKDPNFSVCNAALFIFGFSMFGSTFLLPLFLQNTLGFTALQAGAVFLPVGIIQGIMSPISGMMADKLNPKVPIILGIMFMSSGMYLNSFLSLFSMHSQIMLPLYLRGLGMGLLFTPLGTVALSGISREKIAQASGLFNVIRQIGGSFGVAIFGALLTRRTIYHTALYSQAVNQNSSIFQNILHRVTQFSQYTNGASLGMSTAQAKALIASHMAQQAFTQAVNDDFFAAAVVSIVAVVPIFFLRTVKKPGAPKEAVHAME
jgi:DHA2 family multidrug resistance protein